MNGYLDAIILLVGSLVCGIWYAIGYAVGSGKPVTPPTIAPLFKAKNVILDGDALGEDARTWKPS